MSKSKKVLEMTAAGLDAPGEQGDHFSGKPGNVGEFDSCHGNVQDFIKCQGNVKEKILSGKTCLKLFFVSCILVSIQVFSTSMSMI